MLKRILITGLSMILINGILVAQSKSVSGKVIGDQEPLPGVNVVVEGTTIGTVTDIDGNYTIQLSDGNPVLVFSFIGYKTKREVVGSRSVINVEMEEDVSQLEEVVVIGYGTVRKSDLTGSVSSIKAEDLTTIPAVNPIEALQGKVAGMQITNNSGAPGSSPVVRIRGVGTAGNPSPIYVVDGVILNDISYLNSGDIASVEVLKDASALAIYGNRGANGVIVVTTKLGKAGIAPTISVTSEYSVQVQQNRIDLLNGRQFAEVTNAITPGTFNNLDAIPNTDWQDHIFQTAPIQNHQLSISGASEIDQYYVSLGYFNQEGTIPHSKYERMTIKLNEKLTPKTFFSLGTNLTISPFKRDNTRNDAPFNVYRASPIVEPYNSSGAFNEVPGVGNVLADFEYTTDNVTKGLTTVGQVYAEARFLKNFTFKTSLGLELFYEENEVFTPVFFVSAAQQNPVNSFAKNNFKRTSWLWENTINYDNSIGKHNINAVAGYTSQEVRNERLNLLGRDLFREGTDFRYLDASNLDATSTRNDIRDANDYYNQISYLGRINYSYDSRYIATFTFRVDGSSKFLGDNKYGYFPAVGLGWNVINEKFISLPEVVSNLKLRGSWGKVGNDKINYLSIYNTIGNNFNAVLGDIEQAYFGQSDSGFGNPDLKWEIVEQVDVGLELGFLNDRLTTEFDYYRRDTEGILIGLPLPDYLGNGSGTVFYNAGKVRNSGLEFNLQWNDKVGDFNYTIGLVGATLKNEMLFVSGVEGSDELLSPRVGNQIVSRTVTGTPIGAFYGYVVEGVFQDVDQINSTPSISGAVPGDLIFKDVNGDNQINGDDRTEIGSPIPDLTYGVNLGLSYKNIGLSLLFQGQKGNEIFNIKETIRPAPYNYEAHVYNYWRGSGTSNSEPRPTVGGNNYLPSTRFIQDGSFFRLRTISISYDLPTRLITKAGLNKARLYARGNNVFTFTDFTGYNPEVADGNPLLNGVDRGTYPVASVYSFGLDITF